MPYFAFGFCLQISEDEKSWDCIRIWSYIVTKKDAEGYFIENTDINQFRIDDLTYTGDNSSKLVPTWPEWSEGIKKDNENNIMLVADGSYS